MKTLVFSDVHNRTEEVSKIISKVSNPDLIISLGDWFDNFGDTPDDAEKTARFVKALTLNKNFIWILGNHDAPYFYPKCNYAWCRGQTKDKLKAINKVFGDKKPFKLYHFDEYYLYTHAGLNPYFLPKSGFCPLWLEERANRAMSNMEKGLYDEFVGVGASRGGLQTFGGITWQDFDEFIPIPGVNQVFGHTKGVEPRQILGESSVNWCLDTNNKHYAVIEDSRITIHEL